MSNSFIPDDSSYFSVFKKIELFSQDLWTKNDVYKVRIDLSKEKEVILDFFPYPSGVGLHIGHTLGYIATDVFSRFQRLQGKNVLHAMGYDAFGLPAEQFAIDNQEHPSVITYKNIDNIKSQLKFLGLDHDDSRSFNTTDVDYYKWTQFIFLKLYDSYFDATLNKVMPISHLIQMFQRQEKTEDEIYSLIQEHRLAYLDEVEVNWCPKLGTVLSNEEVIGGLSERGSHPVIKKPLKQWMFRITHLAQRLVQNLDLLDWPVSVKEMQRNWIGLSHGHEVTFKCSNGKDLTVFTTRLDTLSGVTFCAISKDHPDIASFYSKKLPEENEFDGILTNVLAKHPLKDESIPIFIADYVLAYGTAAVMGVPAHDFRDMVFAKTHSLPVIPVIQPDDAFLLANGLSYAIYLRSAHLFTPFISKGKMINGKSSEEEVAFLESKPFVVKKTYTKLRDWVFSRQRYWGEPFPMVLDENGRPFALEDSALPVELPFLENIRSESIGDDVFKPLDDCEDWKKVLFIKLDNFRVRIIKDASEAEGKQIFVGTRETNTMPNWAGSCWYYLRYMDNKNSEAFIGDEAKNYWEKPKKIGAIDLYLGGAEHAVLHLLYARFWHIALYDLNLLQSPEPFQRLFNQGMILGPSYSNSSGVYFHYLDVKKVGEDFFSISSGEPLIQTIGKIGKRYKNGVTPEEVCNEYSIDALRLFMMYLGPLDQSKPWDYSAIKGMVKLLDRVFSLSFDVKINDSDEVKYLFNKMLKKFSDDIQNLRFNTAISSFIIFLNSIEVMSSVLYKKIIVLFSPFAPHLSEFLYQKHFKDMVSVVHETWPTPFEHVHFLPDAINLVITVNGRKRDEIKVPSAYSKAEVLSFVEGYCNDNNISYKKIVIPAVRDFWCANIVV